MEKEEISTINEPSTSSEIASDLSTKRRSKFSKILIAFVVLVLFIVSYGVLAKNYNWWPGQVASPASTGFFDASILDKIKAAGNKTTATISPKTWHIAALLYDFSQDMPPIVTCVINDQDIKVCTTATPGPKELKKEIPQKEFVLDAYFNSEVGVKKFIEENSYGLQTIAVDVYGPYVVDGPPQCHLDLLTAIRYADKDVDFRKYDSVGLFYPYPFGAEDTCTGAVGTQGKEKVITKDGTVSLATAWYQNGGTKKLEYLDFGIAHELGHNFGTLHPLLLLCPSGPWDIDPFRNCDYSGRDQMDMMGSKQGHFNAALKDLLGWFKPGQLVMVTKTGTYNLDAYETNTKRIKALKIPRGGSDYIFVEFRQPIGFDTELIGNYRSDVLDGVIIHTITAGQDQPWLLVPNPRNVSEDPFPKIALRTGATFVDPVSKIEIKTESIKNKKAKVSVRFPPKTK